MADNDLTLVVALQYGGKFYKRFNTTIIHTTDDSELPTREVQYQAMKKARELVMDVEYDHKLGRFRGWRNALT